MQSPAKEVGCLRHTSVVVVTMDVYIIVSLSTRKDTQVIYVDPTTGGLCYKGNFGRDVFSSEDEAFNCITNGSKWVCKSITYGRAILGYSALGSFGILLVATKLSATIRNLPGGGCVYTLIESQWMEIPLQNPQPQGKGELKNIQELAELDIDGKHYFCETRDTTRPFPSRMPFAEARRGICVEWMVFDAFQRHWAASALCHSSAECRVFGSSGQQEGVVALTALRSRLHPGNEVECEQLVWVPKRAGQSVPFNTYIWRQGTIPIWWGAELKMTAAEAEILSKTK